MEAFSGSPEMSWAVFARLGRIWGVFRVRLGVPEDVLETSSILGRLARILDVFRGVLEAFWEHVGSTFGRFSVILSKMSK